MSFHSGAPLALVFRRYAPAASFGGGFEGDNRTSASTSVTATARTIGVVFFSASGASRTMGTSSGSSYLGPWELTRGITEGLLGRSYSNVRVSVDGIEPQRDGISFTARSAGGNPMVPGAPDIDTIVQVRAVFSGNSIRMLGGLSGDGFPNAEIFIIGKDHTSGLLLDWRTGSNVVTGPFTRLFGEGAGNNLGSFDRTYELSGEGKIGADLGGIDLVRIEP